MVAVLLRGVEAVPIADVRSLQVLGFQRGGGKKAAPESHWWLAVQQGTMWRIK